MCNLPVGQVFINLAVSANIRIVGWYKGTGEYETMHLPSSTIHAWFLEVLALLVQSMEQALFIHSNGRITKWWDNEEDEKYCVGVCIYHIVAY